MTDREIWDTAVAAITAEYAELPPAVHERLLQLLHGVRNLKKAIYQYTAHLDASAICAGCGGECCTTGKHHFTVVDLLVHLVEGHVLPVPRFASGECPYLGDGGCMMDHEYRPYNCITFNCDRIDAFLGTAEREECMEAERKLRASYRLVEELFGNSFMHGLLITSERDVVRDRVPVLRFCRL